MARRTAAAEKFADEGPEEERKIGTMKKLVFVLIALALLNAVPSAWADGTAWDFDYTDYRLNGYLGGESAVVVPEDIDGCTVDILGMDFLHDNDAVASLTLPSSLRQVEGNAVSFCDNLTGLIIPEGVQVIGDNCFIGNPALVEITVPASVRYIGTNSFGSNESLKKVTFLGECPVFAGAALDWIADGAEIYVPDDQLDAYAQALYEAGSAAAVLPSGANAVVYDRTTDPSLFEFDAATGTVTLFGGFDTCVEVPAEIGGVPVRAIGAHAFEQNRYLCMLTLPEGLEVIGESAFEWCNNLVHVDFPSTLKTVENRAFYAGYMGCGLDLPAAETIGDEAFAQCIRITDPVYLPEGLKTIGSSAFYCCSWLGEVYLPSTVETIGERAFADSAMNYLVFEGVQLPEIAQNAFENCWYLADIDLNTKASRQDMLSLQAMVDAAGLTCRVWRMQNPDVDYINDGLDVYENGVMTAYSGEQTHLRPWDIFDDVTVTALGEGVFRGNQTIEYFSVPYNDAFTTIGAEAFAGSSVRVVDLFDSVTTIGDGAFRDCLNIEALVLPDSVTTIGADALSGCANLSGLVLPGSVTTIGEGALSGCEKIEELVIPASVTNIGSGALSGCTGLKKLTVLCDPAILPADLLEGCDANMAIFAAETATDEQLAHLSAVAGRAWNNPVTRIGEPLPEVLAMPYEPLPGEDFWYDADFARLDRYQGYELNLVLPRGIDGVQLTMLGGDVLGRAAYAGDDDIELPVVSLVIPENYTELTPYAFENCETLETVICYAPIELLPDCAFAGCVNLREVVFVNGVRSIGMNVFDGCASLETVYIGQYTEEISEYAFADMNGDAVWNGEDCITDPALMPDVDALLANVKRDPMPEPEPEPTPAPAVPVGGEGAAFFGLWIGTEMDMGGETVKLSDWDMVMNLLLLEDGRMIAMDEEVTDWSVLDGFEAPGWRVEDGIAIGDGCTMTVLEDGRLALEEDGMLLYFERSDEQIDLPSAPAQPDSPDAQTDAPATKPETPAAGADAPATEPGTPAAGADAPAAEPGTPAAEPETPEVPAASSGSADAAAHTEIKYVCKSADVSGYSMDASMLGGEYSMIFHADGSAAFVVVGNEMPGIGWVMLENGNFEIDMFGTRMEIVWTDEGFDMNYMDSMLMHFVPEN